MAQFVMAEFMSCCEALQYQRMLRVDDDALGTVLTLVGAIEIAQGLKHQPDGSRFYEPEDIDSSSTRINSSPIEALSGPGAVTPRPVDWGFQRVELTFLLRDPMREDVQLHEGTWQISIAAG